MQSAGRGIQAALGTLFDRTAPVVYGAMRRVLHSPTEAAQATMNIYVELWRTARRCPPAPDSAHAFLAGLARAELIRQHHGIDRTGRPSIDGTHEAASSRETAQIRSGGCRALS
ncbi:MAG: sigma factor [Sporichthyaceae bacterium]